MASEGGFLGGRGLRLGDLERPVRRVIFTTYAVLLGIALAIALRDSMGGEPYLVDPGIALPKVVAWVAAAGCCVGVIFLVSGAARARTRWRY
ncbi:MAG TPA: hypothetical protein VFI86_10530, partial [Burkholderiales bacterium]|nr:hypothetical protein [Burkholderiales bacterium]